MSTKDNLLRTVFSMTNGASKTAVLHSSGTSLTFDSGVFTVIKPVELGVAFTVNANRFRNALATTTTTTQRVIGLTPHSRELSVRGAGRAARLPVLAETPTFDPGTIVGSYDGAGVREALATVRPFISAQEPSTPERKWLNGAVLALGCAYASTSTALIRSPIGAHMQDVFAVLPRPSVDAVLNVGAEIKTVLVYKGALGFLFEDKTILRSVLIQATPPNLEDLIKVNYSDPTVSADISRVILDHVRSIANMRDDDDYVRFQETGVRVGSDDASATALWQPGQDIGFRGRYKLDDILLCCGLLEAALAETQKMLVVEAYAATVIVMRYAEDR